MKKWFLSFLTLYFLSVSPFAYGEDNGDNDNFLNVQLDALKILVGAVDASVDVKIHDNILVGLRYWTLKLDVLIYKYEYSGVGGGVTYAFSGALQDSFTIGMDYINLNANVDYIGGATTDTTGTLLLTYVGYHWFWESFNMALILGSGSLDTKKTTTVIEGESVETEVPNLPTVDLKFKLGFAF